MRYLTIILAVGFGMALSWVMLLNPQEVLVRLNTDGPGPIQPPVWQMAMWEVIFFAVAIGIAIGFLLTWSGGAETRNRLRSLEYDRQTAVDQDNEPDYVLGMTRRK